MVTEAVRRRRPVSGGPCRHATHHDAAGGVGVQSGALAFLGERLRPLGMAAMAGFGPERVIREEGDKPLVPGLP